MGLGNPGATQILTMLLIVGVIVLVPIGMIVWVARWIARRSADDLAASNTRPGMQIGAEDEPTDGGSGR